MLPIPAAAFALAALLEPPGMLPLDGEIERVHDPAIIREGEWYYVFATGGSIRRSRDLRTWTSCGRVFDKLPEWALREIPSARGGYWAPDISRHEGEYRLYYSVSTFGKNASAIGLAVNRTLDPGSADYRWEDRGMVVRSKTEDDFNAIDPHLAIDAEGHHWLSFGSFWGGIKMRRVDPASGLLHGGDSKLYSLAARPRRPISAEPGGPLSPPAIEAPFIARRGGYYYLFVSFDFCCRGVKSTYNIVVGRSAQITGPYTDASGTPMLEGGGTRMVSGTTLWRGPGHQAVLLQQGGPDLLVFHAYDGVSGRPTLHISTLVWEDGWPRAAALPGDPIP